MISFASDNNSGIHPNILQAIHNANIGHQVGYGADPYTELLKEKFNTLFGQEVEISLVFNGTGANTLALQCATETFHSIICAETAHINVDECASPEKLTGCKLISIPTTDGKLTPELIRPHLHGFGDQHHAQPKVISITQTTEMGTLYTISEIKALAALAHQYSMYLHVDGARIANAIATLKTDLKTMISDTGVDFMSFGGTKNGMMMGEAIIFLKTELANYSRFYRKQNAQLFSKMRYHAAQFLAYFDNDLWIQNATHANKMAQLLVSQIKDIKGIEITQKVDSNGIFAIVPQAIIAPLMEKYFFYVWDENKNEIRWMCSFDTTEEDIMSFVKCIKTEIYR